MRFFKWNAHFIFVIALYLLVSIVSVAFPLSLMNITDTLIGGGNERLMPLYIGCSSLGISQMVLVYTSGKLNNSYVANRMIQLREQINSVILNTSFEQFNQYDKEEYQNLLYANIENLEEDYYNAVLNIITKGLLLSCSLITLIVLQPMLTLALVVIIILISVLPLVFSVRIIKLKEEHINLNGKYINITNEIISGFNIIRIYCRQKIFSEKANENIKFLEKKRLHLKNTMLKANVIFGSATILIMLIIFLLGGYLVSKEMLTVGSLIAFIQLIMYVIEPSINIAQDVNKVTSTKPIREQIQSILKLEVAESSNHEFNIIREIHLKGISYVYENATAPILKNINLRFEKGKKYAIVGGNGCGKSTLLKIIAGLISGYNGEIYINQKNHKGTINSIGFVDQDNFLFQGTILNNINLFNEDNFLENDIQRLIKQLDFETLLLKLNEDVGSNGECLSGGQRQKVSIARAIFQSPQLLLLDEPNSALDSENSELLYRLIENMKDCICIMITHEDEDALNIFDEIIEVKNGEAYVKSRALVS
ncbi:Vitamin B12 import ATP-binding protein BtuD [Neobacillus rhizosphaerae]|uniref:Vitamin B12 import ATP-binding protein BtuD n=1 Tax=Neobacillus rhizosphaerae TaxID=2880965 RepID=A0ABN8KLI1_9BACI|nr:ABC transporter ATP-binding protein [Neobacillus rhizosphaerae]CAH2713685.1 Vitamin B12 import ATP-binding protein BtuD [Neobacillus rhizosphaerae]